MRSTGQAVGADTQRQHKVPGKARKLLLAAVDSRNRGHRQNTLTGRACLAWATSSLRFTPVKDATCAPGTAGKGQPVGKAAHACKRRIGSLQSFPVPCPPLPQRLPAYSPSPQRRPTLRTRPLLLVCSDTSASSYSKSAYACSTR